MLRLSNDCCTCQPPTAGQFVCKRQGSVPRVGGKLAMSRAMGDVRVRRKDRELKLDSSGNQDCNRQETRGWESHRSFSCAPRCTTSYCEVTHHNPTTTSLTQLTQMPSVANKTSRSRYPDACVSTWCSLHLTPSRASHTHVSCRLSPSAHHPCAALPQHQRNAPPLSPSAFTAFPASFFPNLGSLST